MIIQPIRFPKPGEAEKMYLRCSAGGVRLLPKGALDAERYNGAIRFNTYFNMFSRAKWDKYTVMNGLQLSLSMVGDARVELVTYGLRGKEVKEAVVSSVEVSAVQKREFLFPYPAYDGELGVSFIVYPLSERFSLYGGAYVTDVEEDSLPEIRLALAICSYRREDFVMRTMRMLKEEVFAQPESILHGKVKVYLADNGQTLSDGMFADNGQTLTDKQLADNGQTLTDGQLADENIHLFANRNSGGSGGFSRAAIEAMADREYQPTHIIIMDDDITFEVDALERNYTFLRLLKPQYRGAMIGGAMFRSDDHRIQHAAGELYTVDGIAITKRGLDMTKTSCVLWNEREESINYLGWWYCCVPREIFQKKHYSLPMFVQMDDIEFSLRNKDAEKIVLNGICCWHLPFELKWSGYITYYRTRNNAIIKSMMFPEYSRRRCISDVSREALGYLFRLNYKQANLSLQGAEDFLKGPSWLAKQNWDELNRDVISRGDRLEDMEEIAPEFRVGDMIWNGSYHLSAREEALRKLTLNGWLLPANKTLCLEVDNPPVSYLYRVKKAVMYDKFSGKGLVAKKDYKAFVQVMSRWFKFCVKTVLCFDRVVRSYKRQHDAMTTEEFWREHLDF